MRRDDRAGGWADSAGTADLSACLYSAIGPRMCRNRGGRERRPRGAPGMAIYLLAARRAERPAARTLRTGYCEARGRAERMVDRRETELKNHFDGEQ